MTDEVQAQLARFRNVRRELERSVLPLATSIDGRRFELQCSLHGLDLRVGGYVELELDDGAPARLGQILTLDFAHLDTGDLALAPPDGHEAVHAPVQIRAAIGSGVVLTGDGTPFHDAHCRTARQEELEAWLTAVRPRRAALGIGDLQLAPGLSAVLDAGGFDRHTFLCGQSGSGKTYSLGVVLERLLAETTLRVVVLDPNSDYVRLAELRAAASGDDPLINRYLAATAAIDVRRGAGVAEGVGRLRLRFAELTAECQAAILRLDPVADGDEYAVMEQMLRHDAAGRSLIESAADIESMNLPGAAELAVRAANLGVVNWDVWEKGEGGSLVEALERRDWRCLVVDLGSLGRPDEQAVVASTVLSTLWRLRHEREPVLVVIDEAHNVCPQRPEGAITAIATRQAVQIAAEGRKFGLYLLVATQRPKKVHENIVTQCDNLLLMRMNSAADLDYLESAFSFVPASLLAGAAHFRIGEALVAGKISPEPMMVRFGSRLSEEGGADVPASWADVPS